MLLILCEQGDPKGVMCSHDGCMTNVLSVKKNLPLVDDERLVFVFSC